MVRRSHRWTTILIGGCAVACLLVVGFPSVDAIRQARLERRFVGTWALVPQVWIVDPTNASLRGATLPARLSPAQIQEFREDYSWNLWVKGARVSAEPATWRVSGDRLIITRESPAPSRHAESIWEWSFDKDDSILLLRGIDVTMEYRLVRVASEETSEG